MRVLTLERVSRLILINRKRRRSGRKLTKTWENVGEGRRN